MTNKSFLSLERWERQGQPLFPHMTDMKTPIKALPFYCTTLVRVQNARWRLYFSCHKLPSGKASDAWMHTQKTSLFTPAWHWMNGCLNFAPNSLQSNVHKHREQAFGKETGWFPGSHLRSGVSDLQRQLQAHRGWPILYAKFPRAFVSMENLNNGSGFLDLLRPAHCAPSRSDAKKKESCSLHSSLYKVCCHMECIWKCLSNSCYIFMVIFIFMIVLFIFVCI